MITDIEEESKTKFSMGVEFTFLLKGFFVQYVVFIAFIWGICYDISQRSRF